MTSALGDGGSAAKYAPGLHMPDGDTAPTSVDHSDDEALVEVVSHGDTHEVAQLEVDDPRGRARNSRSSNGKHSGYAWSEVKDRPTSASDSAEGTGGQHISVPKTQHRTSSVKSARAMLEAINVSNPSKGAGERRSTVASSGELGSYSEQFSKASRAESEVLSEDAAEISSAHGYGAWTVDLATSFSTRLLLVGGMVLTLLCTGCMSVVVAHTVLARDAKADALDALRRGWENRNESITLGEVEAMIEDSHDVVIKGVIGYAVATLVLFVLVAALLFLQRAKHVGEQQGARRDQALLLQLLPPHVIHEINSGRTNIAYRHPDLTFCFTDIVGFTRFTHGANAAQLVRLLNCVFNIFDAAAIKHGIFKVKTMGDAFMGVCGLEGTITEGRHHVLNTLEWGLEVLRAIRELERDQVGMTLGKKVVPINIRIGVSVGPCVSGVLGSVKPAYDFWGDTVNVASRMESCSKPGRVNCTPDVYERAIEAQYGYDFDAQRGVFIKGKGKMDTYLLVDPLMEPAPEETTAPASPKATRAWSDAGASQAMRQLAAIQSDEAYQSDLQHVLHALSTVGEDLELHKAMGTVVNTVCNLLDCDRATLFMVDDVNKQLWSYNDVVSRTGNQKKIRVPIHTGIAGYAASTGEIQNIADAYADSRFNATVDHNTGYKTDSLLAFPVRKGEDVVAVVQAVNKHTGRFTIQDEFLISLMGKQLASQLAHSILFEKLKLSEARQQILLQIARDMNENIKASDSGSQIFESVTHGAKQIVDCDRCSLFVVDPQTQVLYSLLTSSTGEMNTIEVRLGHGIVGTVAKEGVAMNIKDARSCPLFDPSVDEKTGYVTRSLLALPIRDEAQVLGVLVVMNKVPNTEYPLTVARGSRTAEHEAFAFMEEDEQILEVFTTFISLSVRDLRLMDMHRKQQETLKLLLGVSVLGSAATSHEDLIDTFQQELPTILQCERAMVFILADSPDERGKRCLKCKPENGRGMVNLTLNPEGCGYVGRVATGDAAFFNTTDKPFADGALYNPAYDNVARLDRVDTSCVVQVRLQNTLVGVLQAFNKKASTQANAIETAGKVRFSPSDLDILRDVGVVVALHLATHWRRQSLRSGVGAFSPKTEREHPGRLAASVAASSSSHLFASQLHSLGGFATPGASSNDLTPSGDGSP